jgi:flagella basal body P-ring formation protein FlgA
MFYLPVLLLSLAAEIPAAHPVDRDAALAAMKRALALRPETSTANIEIVDVSHFPVPDGEMEFDWKGLTPPSTGQTVARWRGVIHHDVDHSYSIWAMVRITVPCRRVIAVQNIRPEIPIAASDLQEEAYEGFPSDACNSGIGAVTGKVATRIISANSPILPMMLASPASVVKGEPATALYRDGAVQLSLPVIPEKSGRIGELIPVQNPVTHKTLLAQVVGEGKVLIGGDKQ